jgi:hypothetical protein
MAQSSADANADAISGTRSLAEVCYYGAARGTEPELLG